MLLALLLPAMIHAANGEFDTPNQAFTWYSKGPGCMHLKLMTTNASPFRTLHEANYFLRDSEGNLTKVFYIYEQNSENSGYVRSLYLNLLGSESLLYLTNDTKWKPLCLISYVSAEQHDAVRTNKENGYAELDWYYPVRFAGKRYTLRVEAKLFHEGGSITDYVKDLDITKDILVDDFGENIRSWPACCVKVSMDPEDMRKEMLKHAYCINPDMSAEDIVREILSSLK